MILVFSIFKEDGKELFTNYLVERSYFTDIQIKTIANSISKLLNIVNLTSKSDKDSYLSKTFTIVNLRFHIIKFKSFFYAFVTVPINFIVNTAIELENDYTILIKKIHEIILLCTGKEPHFELDQNHYFIQNTANLITQFNSYLFKLMKRIEEKKEREIPTKEYLQKSFGKYLIVGTGSAGKSSILAQFISNWDQNKLDNIRPTIKREDHNFKDSMVKPILISWI